MIPTTQVVLVCQGANSHTARCVNFKHGCKVRTGQGGCIRVAYCCPGARLLLNLRWIWGMWGWYQVTTPAAKDPTAASDATVVVPCVL